MSSRQSSSRGRKRASVPSLNTDPTTNTAKTTRTTTTRDTGPYDRNFQQILIDGGVYPEGYEYPDGHIPSRPDNWDEIHRRLTKSRASLSPSQCTDETFREFVRADTHAPKERQVTASVIPLIEGKVKDPKCVSGGIPFNNLDQLPRSTLVNSTLIDVSLDKDELVPGNPDLYYGARPEQLDARIRTELSGHIIPSTQHDLPIAPNFFLAGKGPNGSMAVADSQACYDGALGARGMHSLQSYGQDGTVYDKKAYTVSCVYYGGLLKMYTSHPAIGPGGETEYYMTPLKAWALKGDPDTFRAGVTAYRNARDWAKEKRDDFIFAANERRNNSPPGASIANASGPSLASTFANAASRDELDTINSPGQESRTSLNDDSNNTQAHIQESGKSTDELELDIKLPAKRASTHSKRSQDSRQKRYNASRSNDSREREWTLWWVLRKIHKGDHFSGAWQGSIPLLYRHLGSFEDLFDWLREIAASNSP